MEYCDDCKKIRAAERQEEILDMLAKYDIRKNEFNNKLESLEAERNYKLEKLRKSREELF